MSRKKEQAIKKNNKDKKKLMGNSSQNITPKLGM